MEPQPATALIPKPREIQQVIDVTANTLDKLNCLLKELEARLEPACRPPMPLDVGQNPPSPVTLLGVSIESLNRQATACLERVESLLKSLEL